MEAILFVPPILAIYAAYVYMISKYAQDQGRNFWLWVFLSICVPFVSSFVLLLLPEKK